MTRAVEKDSAVIIPARNEAERIGACLTALAGQWPDRVTVILVLNNTTDDTKGTARRIATQHDLDVEILDHTLPSDQGVGTARRLGCDHALRLMPRLRYLLTTDADCVVTPGWIADNIAQLQTADAVCGKIELIAQEAGILDGMDRTLATNEGVYRNLVQQIYARHAEGCADIASTHGEAAGASLAFRKAAYLAVGGFEAVRCGEDRQIIRAMRASGHRVRHADDVIAYASCRLTGRAKGGMSDALKARIEGTDYLIDDCLPDAEWLVTNAVAEMLGVWPPQVPEAGRVHVGDLPHNIEILKRFLNSKWTAIAASALTASTATAPASHHGPLLSGKGSAAMFADPNMQATPGFLGLTPTQTRIETPADADVARSAK